MVQLRGEPGPRRWRARTAPGGVSRQAGRNAKSNLWQARCLLAQRTIRRRQLAARHRLFRTATWPATFAGAANGRRPDDTSLSSEFLINSAEQPLFDSGWSD